MCKDLKVDSKPELETVQGPGCHYLLYRTGCSMIQEWSAGRMPSGWIL